MFFYLCGLHFMLNPTLPGKPMSREESPSPEIPPFPNSLKIKTLLTVEVVDDEMTLKLWQVDGNR